MAHGIGDCDRRALRNAEERRALRPDGFDHGFEVAHKRRERDVGHVAISQTVAAPVIADQAAAVRQMLQQRRPDRALPVIFDVGEPIGDFDQRDSDADRGEREVDAFRSPTKRHLLVACRRRYRSRQLGGDLSLAHGPHEPDALARGGPDDALLLAAVADGAPRGVDAAGERRFGYDAAVPHGGNQIILADHAIAVADQKNQQVEDLRLGRDERALATQLAPVGIKNVIFEVKQQVAAPISPLLGEQTLPHPAGQPKIKPSSRTNQAPLEAERPRR